MPLNLDIKPHGRIYFRAGESGPLGCIEFLPGITPNGAITCAFSDAGGAITYWREAIVPPEVAAQFPSKRPADRGWRPAPSREGATDRPPRQLFPGPQEPEDAPPER